MHHLERSFGPKTTQKKKANPISNFDSDEKPSEAYDKNYTEPTSKENLESQRIIQVQQDKINELTQELKQQERLR